MKRDRNSVGVLDTLTGAIVPAANKSIMGKISVSGHDRMVIFGCLPCKCTGIATCSELGAKTHYSTNVVSKTGSSYFLTH